jgi:small multidrug resistance pump
VNRVIWIVLLAGIASNASGSVLLKFAFRVPVSFTDPATMLQNWRVVPATFLYGMAFVLYAIAVNRLPLNIAHPISTAGAIVLVGLVSWLGLRESFSIAQIAGYVLLVVGVALIATAPGGRQ